MSTRTSSRRALGRILLLGVVAGASAGLGGCNEPKQPPVGVGGPVDSAEQVLFGVRTLLTSSGVQRGELTADTAYTFNDQTKFIFLNAKVNFNTETGAPNGTMRADRGNYDLRQQVLEGFGHVVITTVDGRKLTSPHLKFNQLANEVSSDTTFQVVAGDRTQSGIGFKADPNLTHFQCFKACRTSGTVNIPAQ
ncbi:MAG TPA: LPS export ABC transporter periplasmic protein LptC [Gemmatimonadaceae bacterium]|nr:LPS export ABC transporter periplasmic protein LptC [Gemmatimonadaceae bacterium]